MGLPTSPKPPDKSLFVLESGGGKAVTTPGVAKAEVSFAQTPQDQVSAPVAAAPLTILSTWQVTDLRWDSTKSTGALVVVQHVGHIGQWLAADIIKIRNSDIIAIGVSVHSKTMTGVDGVMKVANGMDMTATIEMVPGAAARMRLSLGAIVEFVGI